jgi:hypothetical protein
MPRFNGDSARFCERKQNNTVVRTRELLQAAGLSVSKPESSKKPRGTAEKPAS